MAATRLCIWELTAELARRKDAADWMGAMAATKLCIWELRAELARRIEAPDWMGAMAATKLCIWELIPFCASSEAVGLSPIPPWAARVALRLGSTAIE
ncbi:hypothetical protein SAMN04489747_1446 [Auraticoccus monumenti]|uniref:Uncharacterized protein n=1 Tax=Auraticoccus monumenti TaxID=675864 RepID=A0A1G6WHS4_9ACTN|nr:hypothetical protein SAMN04489747_1446 [Auraticoccus monumenti]